MGGLVESPTNNNDNEKITNNKYQVGKVNQK